MTKYTAEEFKEAVSNSTEVQTDLDLQGAPIGVTIGTLMDYATENPENTTIHTSDGHDIPHPLGFWTVVTSLEEVEELLTRIGTHTISDVDSTENGNLKIAHHFD